MSAKEPMRQSSDRLVRVLGICWVMYGIARLIEAAFLVTFSNTATVMFGALLNRVADPFLLMNLFHFAYGVIIAISVICGVLGALAGLALASGSAAGSGRTVVLIAAILSLSSIPFGLTLGVVTLFVLFSWNPRQITSNVSSAQVPDMKRQTLAV